MNATVLLALVFLVLLALEWRYRLKSVRVIAVLLAMAVWSFFQPIPDRAARRAIVMPPAQRVTELARGGPLSEYASGVATMERAVYDDMNLSANERFLSVVVLFWLACSPIIPRSGTLSARQPSDDKGADGAPYAKPEPDPRI